MALDKTHWATNILVFLGILLNTIYNTVCIHEEKRRKAVVLLQGMLEVKNKKTTVLKLQQLTGLLNFFEHAIFPARAYTRKFYMKFKGENNIFTKGLNMR